MKMKVVGNTATIKMDEKVHETVSSCIYNGKFDEKSVIIKRVTIYSHKSELDYLRELDHANVVKYLYHDKDCDFIYIVLEKCDMTMQQYIEDKKEELNHYGLLWQIVTGMEYIHEAKNIIHRDLKPTNILLVFGDGVWTAKISDFGISKALPHGQSQVSQSLSGSCGYMAPECLCGEKATKRSDMFSLGLIFTYVVSEGQHPFGDDLTEANRNILSKTMSPKMDVVKSEFKHDVNTLIQSMVSFDPEERPNIKTVQAHHMFWKASRKLLFMQEVSDYLIQGQVFQKMQPILDSNQENVAPNWREAISEKSELVGTIIHEMKNKKQKDGVCDLIRNIRNLLHHYNEKVSKCEGFDEEIGGRPDGIYNFFKTLFPNLWDYVYTKMATYSADFKDFYEYDDSRHLVLEGSPENDITELEEESRGCENNSENSQSVKDFQSESGEATLAHAAGQNENGSPSVVDGSAAAGAGTTGRRELVLRSYQWELAEQALEGNNSLIVAPTGSGKTVVLTQIIKDHFARKPDGRVMFIVPKTALARQQYKFLKRYLPKGMEIEFMIGEVKSTVPIGKLFLNSKVSVLTHQILINELKREDDCRYLSFDDISLIIFDECHSTHSSHPYRVLMNILLDFKDRKPEDITTQVVGVTASPGVGKAKYKDTVYKNLIRLLANLNITSAPVTVVENIEELQKNNNEIKKSLIQIETEQEFSKQIQLVIMTIEKVITEKILERTATVRKSPGNKAVKAYDNWVHDLILHAQQHISDGDKARKVIVLAEHLNMYHSLLRLKDLIPEATRAVSSMVNWDGEAQEKKFLRSVYQGLSQKATGVQTPMVEKLIDVISEEFIRNPDARCMVFVQRRQTAAFLCAYLVDTDKLRHLKPIYMIGRHSRDGEDYHGTDQVIARKEFEEGISKVLICTSVAEEGLNFVACSLVIMYNYVTGEVGEIQRAGRARAKKSRAIIITSLHSNHVKQHQENRLRAEATALAIKDVKNKENTDPDGLVKEIREDQRLQKLERHMLEKAERDQVVDEEPEKWKVLCATCKNFLTTGDKLRKFEMHTVVHDEEFDQHVTKCFVEKEKGPLWGDVDYLCNNDICGIKVAWGMVRNGKRYPTLSIKKILLGDESGMRFICPRKKKDMPFKISKKVGDDVNNIYEATDKKGPVDEAKPVDEETCLEMLNTWDAYGDDY